MDWWLVAVAGLGAAACLGAAAHADRRSRRRARAAVEAPGRTVPGLPPDAPSPSYLQPGSTAAAPLDEAERAALADRLAGAAEVVGGWADDRFVTDPASRWAVVDAPVVLVTPAVRAFRALWPALAAARARAAGLVVAAADFDTAALAALAANAAAGTMRCLAVRCPDAAALDAAAAATGGAVVSLAALQSGAVRPADLGACATWVSGPDVSWALGLPDRARVSEP